MNQLSTSFVMVLFLMRSHIQYKCENDITTSNPNSNDRYILPYFSERTHPTIKARNAGEQTFSRFKWYTSILHLLHLAVNMKLRVK